MFHFFSRLVSRPLTDEDVRKWHELVGKPRPVTNHIWNSTMDKNDEAFFERQIGMTVQEAAEKSVEKLGQGAEGGGLRYNAGKILMEATPPEWEIALADVTTQGSKKYALRNWEEGMDWSTMIGCMKRHINKFLLGERYDGKEFNKELGTTGCHHLAMVAWNALALMSYDLRQIGENDLPGLQYDLWDRVNAFSSDMDEWVWSEDAKTPPHPEGGRHDPRYPITSETD